MTLKQRITLCTTIILCMSSLTGCSQDKPVKLTNELRFSLEKISDLKISYDDEEVIFFPSDENTLVIKEYMTTPKDNYYAKVKQNHSSIHISEGAKPIFKDNFYRYIEIYLPASYQHALTVTTSDGDIDMSGIDLHVSVLRIDSTSGTMQIDSAKAEKIYLSSTSGTLKLGIVNGDTIRVETTSGEVICEEVNGYVTYATTSGNAQFSSAIGSGSYKVNNSGTLSAAYTQVQGNLTLFNKNGDIKLTLPKKLEFGFEAAAKNGTILTSFQDQLRTEGDTVRGTVGNSPDVTVRAETKNGNIEVTQ